LADSLGIGVEGVHRALPDALTCARIFCALFPKLCANAASVRQGVALLAARRAGRSAGRRAPGRRVPAEQRPDLSQLPDDPGVYIFRDERGRPLYVGKSVSLRTRARSHFCAPAGWTERAEVVDYRPTNSELGALVLENRLIKEWQPPGNRQLKRTDRWVYLRCRLDIPYPVLEVSAEPACGHAVSVGPLRGRRLAGELADHLSSLFKLRHCGRSMKRREHPSIYGQMGRCCSPCLGDLDPNAYRRQIDQALALFDGSEAAEHLLLADIDRRIAAASSARRYEAAAALLRRRERLAGLLERLGGVLRAVHADPRLVLAHHPSKARVDAFWVIGGRVADWGPLPPKKELQARTTSAFEGGLGRVTSVPAEEVDEVRIVSAWLAEHDPPQLSLAAGELTGDGIGRILRQARKARREHPECVSGVAA
jgi:DNA polymerase-3 subunit epsilon